MEVTIIRPPLVYGPGVKANFKKLMGAVKKGVPLPLGCVENSRSFIGLTNLSSAVTACVEHPSAGGQTFLVSDGEDISSRELVLRMAVALHRPARLIPVPVCILRLAGKLIGRLDQVERLLGSLVVDTSKIRRELDWKPVYSMKDELNRMV